MKVKVTVEKLYRQVGAIEVDAAGPEDAQKLVAVMMTNPLHPLRTNDRRIKWDADMEYVDESFTTTGDDYGAKP